MRILLNGVSNELESTSSDVWTESSDSEFFTDKDIKDSGNQISQQWEAIERTLYQETGEQVTDPELLKECKLWREAFPHFRVRGTKINVKKFDDEKKEEKESEEGGNVDTDKGIQTLSNHLNLMKINEKRESIKNKVVGELVERLIAKFNNNNNNNNNKGCELKSNLDKKSLKNGFQLSEKRDTLLSGMISPSEKNIGKVPDFLKRNEKPTAMKKDTFASETESYFERGKLIRDLEKLHQVESSSGVTRDQMEKSFYQIFDDWEKEIDDEVNRQKPQTTYSAHTQEISREDSDYPKAGHPKSNLKSLEKPNSRRFKPNKMVPPPDSLSRLTKPFEMTKKIDKKYEGLLEKILERKSNEPIRNLRANSSRKSTKGFRETFEEVTFESVFDEPLKHNKNFPKINKFNNHWLERGEINSNYYLGDSDFSQRSTNSTRTSANPNKSVIASNNHVEKLVHFGMDEKFVEELKKDMILSYKRPARRSGVIEHINLRRPKPHFNLPEQTGKSQKSSSCGDLPKKSKRIRQTKPSLENVKNSKSTNLNNSRVRKSNSSQNGLLPPIESGIICTELTGRPKIGFKNPPKR